MSELAALFDAFRNAIPDVEPVTCAVCHPDGYCHHSGGHVIPLSLHNTGSDLDPHTFADPYPIADTAPDSAAERY